MHCAACRFSCGSRSNLVRGASPPGTPLHRRSGGPHGPLRSGGSLAVLARGAGICDSHRCARFRFAEAPADGLRRILDLGSRSRLPGFFFSRIGFCVQKEAARAQKAILRRRAARLCMQFALGFALRRPCRHAPVVYQPGAPRRNRVGIGGLLKTCHRQVKREEGEGRREKHSCDSRVFPSAFCLLP